MLGSTHYEYSQVKSCISEDRLFETTGFLEDEGRSHFFFYYVLQ